MENYINVFNNEDNFKFESIQILCPPSVPPHFHNQYELLFFETGDASYMVEGNYYDLSEGDLLITNPREMHCPVFKTNREYQRSIIFFTPSYLSDFISDKYNPFSALENRKIGTQNRIDTFNVKNEKIDEKISEIRKYANSDLPEKELLIKTNLLQILISINNIVSSEISNTSVDKINDIILYINNNLSEKITLSELSKRFYLNKFYISHLFKDKIGITLNEYITQKRIMLAKEYLMGGIPPSQVYSKVGFWDYSSFYRAFKKTLGYSPSSIKLK